MYKCVKATKRELTYGKSTRAFWLKASEVSCMKKVQNSDCPTNPKSYLPGNTHPLEFVDKHWFIVHVLVIIYIVHQIRSISMVFDAL